MILCGASSYEKKFYLNPAFCDLPTQVKNELQAAAVLFVEDVGGVFTIRFDKEGTLLLTTDADEYDGFYDEIGAELKIRQMQRDKQELFSALELFYKVFELEDDGSDEEAKKGRSEDWTDADEDFDGEDPEEDGIDGEEFDEDEPEEDDIDGDGFDEAGPEEDDIDGEEFDEDEPEEDDIDGDEFDEDGREEEEFDENGPWEELEEDDFGEEDPDGDFEDEFDEDEFDETAFDDLEPDEADLKAIENEESPKDMDLQTLLAELEKDGEF